jgi:GNAT superfamily N-acetyltransferase
MKPADLAEVSAIAAEVHPDFHERDIVFAEKLRLYPDGARLLQRDGRPAGYLLSHPWLHADPPALDTLLGGLPATPTTYYLHDLALLPEVRRTGAAAAAVEEFAAHARERGFAIMSLVAVNRSAPFWRRHGFEALDLPALAPRLALYEAQARYMVRRL